MMLIVIYCLIQTPSFKTYFHTMETNCYQEGKTWYQNCVKDLEIISQCISTFHFCIYTHEYREMFSSVVSRRKLEQRIKIKIVVTTF